MTLADYMRALDIPGMHTVGGAVRDELLGITPDDFDFVAIGHDAESLRSSFNRAGRVEDLIVAGRPVGIRFWPHDKTARDLAPKGIEICPPRKEVSTGPGHKDFDIIADKNTDFAGDAIRRDFTINAMARNLQTGEIVDPLNGGIDLHNRILRTTSEDSFRDDPLRIVRGLRFASQLGFAFHADTLAQMSKFADGISHLSGERIQEQLTKLLMGEHPAYALRIARLVNVLTVIFPEFEPCINFDQNSLFHDTTVDEHIFEVVQAAADNGASLDVRLAALFHDIGKPESSWLGDDGRLHYYENREQGKRAHENIGADMAAAIMERLRYPRANQTMVTDIVRNHMFQAHNHGGKRSALRFLAKHGADLSLELIQMKRADLTGREWDKRDELDRLDDFTGQILTEIERGNAFTVKQLKVNGNDLARLGVPRGPAMGEILRELLDAVVEDPDGNNYEWLMHRAAELWSVPDDEGELQDWDVVRDEP